MGDKVMRARHAFGSEKDIEQALASGSIDAFDILFLNEGKIGWITKQGEPLIIEDKKQIMPVTELPQMGDPEVIYIFDSRFYFWDGEAFVSPDGANGVTEESVDKKINAATEEAQKYTDRQIASVVEGFEAQDKDIANITVGGVALEVKDKSVDVPIGAGLKESSEVLIDDDGTLSVGKIGFENIIQNEGEFLLFDGGSSAE